MALENINWYPGHMKKTRELITENLKLVDMVIEVVDARIPVSSRNPIIDELVQNKPRIILLNKSDLADGNENKAWTENLKKSARENNAEGIVNVMRVDSLHGTGIKELLSALTDYQNRINENRERKKTLRLMIVGVPNVGKSSFINRLTGRKATQTGDRPGVTKGKQWLTMTNGMQLLDTPGILWPKFEDQNVGLALAYCGSIKDEILDTDSLALSLIGRLMAEYPKELKERYKIDELPDEALEGMELIAKKRGFILGGGRIDYERCARTVLDEFRSGKIGRITLEKVDASTDNNSKGKDSSDCDDNNLEEEK
ncbi:MAG: ribosome biogenesis GTPase YlqF [Firmicutes bacterium]|nr:ribosome biogenesis GTPase YlqF [Bacillota bacterium]